MIQVIQFRGEKISWKVDFAESPERVSHFQVKSHQDDSAFFGIVNFTEWSLVYV